MAVSEWLEREWPLRIGQFQRGGDLFMFLGGGGARVTVCGIEQRRNRNRQSEQNRSDTSATFKFHRSSSAAARLLRFEEGYCFFSPGSSILPCQSTLAQSECRPSL